MADCPHDTGLCLHLVFQFAFSPVSPPDILVFLGPVTLSDPILALGQVFGMIYLRDFGSDSDKLSLISAPP